MNTLSSLVYMNTDLVQDLSSLLIDGYLASKTIREARDKTDSIRLQTLSKNQVTNDLKRTMNDKDSDNKDINKVTDENYLDYNDNFLYLEDRNYDRNEVSYNKIYSMFYFYNTLVPRMKSLDLIRLITSEDIVNNRVYDGEFVEFYGDLSINVLENTVENILNILNCYDTKILDDRVYTKDIGPLSYTMIASMLTYINKELTRNNTFDALVDMNKSTAVLNLNFTYINNKAALYDVAECKCRVLGKVCKVVNKEDKCICLLRKTGLDLYYENFLTSINPYLVLLNEAGYSIPVDVVMNICSPAIQVMPVGISI